MSTENNDQQQSPAAEQAPINGVVVTAAAQPAPVNEKDPDNEVYPEQKNTWYYDDKADKSMGIETYRYDNGGISKRCTLSDGRIAICRRLKGKDRAIINRLVENASDKGNTYKDAIIAVCTKVDDKDIVIEDLDALWYNDLINVQTMAGSLNFM